MAILQPLYISQGRYSSGTDRKLLSAIFEADSNGATVTGVLPPTDHMKVTNSGLSLSISPGFCLIADSTTQNGDSPGVYLCSIDSTDEALTISSGSGTNYIYAEVNETTYTVTNKLLASGTATLTTSASHGFIPGQTVLVNIGDSDFDGVYVLNTGTTGTTVKYSKTGAVASTPVSSAAAKVSVPFAVKQSTTAPSTGKFINLATVTENSGIITSISDTRSFVTARGGVQVYSSSTGTRNASVGRLAWDTDNGILYYYDTKLVTPDWVRLYHSSTGHHDDESTDSSTTAIHHTIGTGAFQVAAGNHTHSLGTTRYAYNASTSTAKDLSDGTNKTISATTSGTANTLATFDIQIQANTTTHVWVVANACVNFSGGETVYLGLGSDDDAFSVRGQVKAVLTPSSGTLSVDVTVPATIAQLMKFTNSTGSNVNKTIFLKAYRTSGTGTYQTISQTLSAIPFSTTSTAVPS